MDSYEDHWLRSITEKYRETMPAVVHQLSILYDRRTRSITHPESRTTSSLGSPRFELYRFGNMLRSDPIDDDFTNKNASAFGAAAHLAKFSQFDTPDSGNDDQIKGSLAE